MRHGDGNEESTPRRWSGRHEPYTHLTDQTKHHAIDRINDLMDGFGIRWGKVK